MLKGRGIIFTLFQGYFFRKNKFETVGETKKALGGFGGMLPRKILENLHATMTILVLLNNFEAKFVQIF